MKFMKLKILHIFPNESYETKYLFKTKKIVTKQRKKLKSVDGLILSCILKKWEMIKECPNTLNKLYCGTVWNIWFSLA